MSSNKNNIVRYEDILKARGEFPDGYITPISITKSQALSDAIGGELYIVRADQGDVLSFKERGSFIKVAEEIEAARKSEKKDLHFVAASEGNHSQGVAKAVAYFSKKYSDMNIRATIIMPEATPQVKRDRTIQVGNGYTDIHIIQPNPLYRDPTGIYDDALALAKTWQDEKNYILVPTFDGKEIVAGQGTVALELQEAGIDFDEIVTACGGGGLSAGIAAATTTKVVAVQPAWVPSAVAALSIDQTITSRLYQIAAAKEMTLDGKDTGFEIHPDGVIIAEVGKVPVDNLLYYHASIQTVTPAQIAYGYKTFIDATCELENGEPDFVNAPELCATLGLAHVLRESIKNPRIFRDKIIAVVVSGRNISLEDARHAYEAGRTVTDYLKEDETRVSKIFDEQTPAYEPGFRAKLLADRSLRNHVTPEFYGVEASATR